MEDSKHARMPAMQLQYVLRLFGCDIKGVTDIARDLFPSRPDNKLSFKRKNLNQPM